MLKNQKLSLLAAPIIMLAATTAHAETNWGVTPVIGADAQWRYMAPQPGFGDNIFKHSYPQGDVYVGVKFNDYIGVQAGYEATSRKTKTVTVLTPVVINGVLLTFPETGANSIQYTTTSRIKGPHADLVGYLPICNGYDVSLIGSVGLAYLQTSFNRKVIQANGISSAPTAAFITNYKARRTVLRLMGGIQQYITDCVGVRATVGWENTNRFKTIYGVFETGAPSISNLQLKNSINYGLGLFVTF